MRTDDREPVYIHRVRWSEIDGQRIVFNGHYLAWLDTAMAEYFRQIGVERLKTGAPDEFDYVVARITMDFQSPARFGDELGVSVRAARLGNASFDAEFTVRRHASSGLQESEVDSQRSETLLLQAVINYVCFDNSKGRSRPIPDDIRLLIADREGSP